ncbi:MAG: hypothetical protein O2800_00265 [Planctomycetota bacterium]|nr:hypothetical protein [Planctomycetota bacterium]
MPDASVSRPAPITTDIQNPTKPLVESVLRLAGTAPIDAVAKNDPGVILLRQSMALRDQLASAIHELERKESASGRQDPMRQVRGRGSLDQALADVSALVRCLDDELLRRQAAARRGMPF